MTTDTKDELFERYAPEYWKAPKARKGQILGILCDTTGMTRKAAIRAMRRLQGRSPGNREGRGRPLYFTPDVTAALKDIWEAGSEVCGELLHPVIAEYVAALARDGLWKHGDEATGKLLAMSEATVKRRLARFLKARRGKNASTTKPSLLKEIIPIFTGPWEGKPPGYGQIDTVVHCGHSLIGDMAWSCNYTDAATLWVEVRAQWNKGEEATRRSLVAIRENLPFAVKGMHPDTGGEFINWLLKRWCDTEGIELTRSRPGHKNDNAYVEQKNGHVVRRFLGYTRIDVPEAVPAMNALYETLCRYLNHFVASRKLIEKVRVGARYRKRYDKGMTPYARVLAHPAVPEEVKERLRAEHARLNPLLLKREVDTLVKTVFDIQKRGRQEKTG